jgi:heat shock protein HslJ
MLVLGLVVAGCGGGGTTQPASSNAGDELRGQTYLSESVTEQGKPRSLVPGTQIVFRFAEDGRLNVRAGCNTISGPASLTGGKLVLRDYATTEIGCDPARQEQDDWLAGVLKTEPAWRLDGLKLRLTSPTTEMVLTTEENRPLIGTEWFLDTVVDGNMASASPGTATLVFDDTKIKITTGCNSGTAQYQLSGQHITVSNVATTRRACPPEQMRPEKAILGVLDGDLTYEIKGAELKLTKSTSALRLRAH